MFSRQLLRFTTRATPAFKRFITFDAASQPRIRIGSTVPNFTAPTTHGDIDFHQYIGNSWTVLFSHPADFTPVCTTELGAFAKLKPEFDARNVKLIGLSAEGVEKHKSWVKDIEEVALDNKPFSYPIIGDESKEVAYLFDMVDEEGFKNLGNGPVQTIRSVFIIDPAKKVRLIMTYPASCGRNSAEVLRVIDALQTGDKNGVVTPIDWTVGQDVIIPPSVSNEAAKEKFGDFKEVKPYLRFTKL
ncbi:hypothetical protein KL918_000350 [Ogataea parapolymorpha]|uniref:Mitochondrial peroxiredoxin PRX1 n=1 Tax=Ogataea parapolymorpha (strain ATCC 26012 / BCRC 20466 / JCM 22074 / NRRL Y-7560 / DL-1) TaxID=871575 RepID=W1Q7Q2_OGAPD|nr:Mitochondrial peroxiredoxin PRX1 [Ogataea parapolymorpha DL-1]ESW96399.1 Mitochondrial peroxiredoxin PRX1 [Ogataea parapolymorpha DL-1]KAG7870146.1 hypothetical protein KL918_000350 [Ogataea parapolymorpha]KAG7875095.1 hypothetical protein KL916_000707 [Ogataea parapolymorpha]